MSRTIPSNITTGLANGDEPVLLVDLLTKSGTHYRWSTLPTSDFTSWAGNTYISKVVKSSPMKIVNDITKEAGCGRLGSFTFEVQNANYNSTTSLWDYMKSEEDYPSGAIVTAYLITNTGTGLDEDDALEVFKGAVTKPTQNLKTVKFMCADISDDAHLPIPQTGITEENYPNAYDHPAKNIDNAFVPISLGAAGDGYFLAFMTDSRPGTDRLFRIDTDRCLGGGSVYLYDRNGFRELDHTWGSNEATGDIDSDALSETFLITITPTDVTVDGTLWTENSGSDEEETIDGSESTYCQETVDWITLDEAFIYWTGFDEDESWFKLVKSFLKAKIILAYNKHYGQQLEFLDADGEPISIDLIADGETDLTSSEEVLLTLGGGETGSPITPESLFQKLTFRAEMPGIGISLVVKFYELVELSFLYEIFYGETDFLCDAGGREFYTTWNSRKTATNGIVSFAEAVEGILRHELGLATADIDDATFDAANTALNSWTGKAYNDSTFKVFGQQQAQENSRDVIKKLCEESGLTYGADYAGSHTLHMIENESTADYTITESEIKKGSFKTWASGTREIYNDFVLNFDKNQLTGAYQQTITISKDSGIASGSNRWYLQKRCTDSFDRYGIIRQKTINCDWITSEGTAWKVIDWYCYFYCFIREFCSFDATLLGLLKAETMDIVNIKHTLTELTTGIKHIIYEVSNSVTKKKLTTSLKGMYIETMGTRYDGPPT